LKQKKADGWKKPPWVRRLEPGWAEWNLVSIASIPRRALVLKEHRYVLQCYAMIANARYIFMVNTEKGVSRF
jgi:hypothetical protein